MRIRNRKSYIRMMAAVLVLFLCACSAGDGFDGFVTDGNSVRRESATWVTQLGLRLVTEQIFIVAGVGSDTAYISLHEKDSRGNWTEVLTTPGFIRRKATGEAQDKTPTVAVYALNASSGIADEPGFVFGYRLAAPDQYAQGADVSIPEVCMRTLRQRAREDCVVVIDELQVLSPETYKSLFGTNGAYFAKTYVPAGSVEVDGRQGVCYEDGCYWVSGTASLWKYDSDWNLVAENKKPFEEFEEYVNHIGDIDVYKNELYIAAESFNGSTGKNIQIAVFDGDTLECKRLFPIDEESGMEECSGVAYNPDTGTLWLSSWAEGDSGRYLYQYDPESGDYLGKIEMLTPPAYIQGIAYYDGSFYLSADDGEADANEPDHLYRTTIEYRKDVCAVLPERAFDDVTRQGEIEGLTFDKSSGRLLLLYNRGLRVVNGRSRGFYSGYSKEISEVFFYDIE